MPERPVDAVTLDEAGRILGHHAVTAQRMMTAAGYLRPRYRHYQLSRPAVEALATKVYRWREHLDDVDPHWITGQRAAALLGVNVTRLNQLAVRGFLPFETTADGTMLYRREQLRVVAHARNARWAQHHGVGLAGAQGWAKIAVRTNPGEEAPSMTDTDELDVVEEIRKLTGYTEEQVRETFPTLVPWAERQDEAIKWLLLSSLA
jgi:hypothetical protein